MLISKSLFTIYFSQFHTNKYDSYLDLLVFVLSIQKSVYLFVLGSSGWCHREFLGNELFLISSNIRKCSL